METVAIAQCYHVVDGTEPNVTPIGLHNTCYAQPNRRPHKQSDLMHIYQFLPYKQPLNNHGESQLEPWHSVTVHTHTHTERERERERTGRNGKMCHVSVAEDT